MAINLRGRKAGQRKDGGDTILLSDADGAGFISTRVAAPEILWADDFGSALGAGNLGNVTVGGTATGTIETGGDRDWFRVTLSAGQSYIIRVTSTSTLDPRFGLLDSNGIGVGGNDDFPGDGDNARFDFTAPVGGTYYIDVNSPNGGGATGTGTYNVSVIVNPSPPPPPTDDFGSQTGAPNIGSITAGGASVTGTVNFNGDRDWFAITLTAGQAYIFTLNRNVAADSLDPHLFLRDSIGNIIAGDDDGGTPPNSRLLFTATATGTYYLDATSFQGSGTGAYTLGAAFDGAPPPPPVDDFGSQIGAANLGSLTVGGAAVQGNIEVGGDRDWFAVTLVAGGLYRFNHDRVTIEDPRFSIRNSAGTIIAGNDDFAPPNVNAQLDFTPTVSGVYYLDANSPFNDNTGTYTVRVTQLNTAPTLGTNAGLTLNEGATGTITTARLDYNDIEQADSAITYTVTTAATNGTLRLNGNALAVNGTFTQADINNNLVTYLHNGGETTSGSFGFSVSDGAGGTVTGQSFALTVTPVDDAPTLTATAINPVFTENGSAVEVFTTGAVASTVETGQTFTGMTITVANVIDGANEQIRVDGVSLALTNGNSATSSVNNLTISVSVTGTTATVSFAGAALSAAQLQTLVGGIAYRHLSDTPTDGDRVVAITQLVDSGSNTAPNANTATLALSSTVNVNPVNDNPSFSGIAGNFQLTRNAAAPVDFRGTALVDPDAASLTVTVSALIGGASAGGAFAASSSGGVTATGAGSTLTLAGTVSALNTYLNTLSNITYLPPVDYSGTAIGIRFAVVDGSGGNLSTTRTSVVVAPVLLADGVAATQNFDTLESANSTYQLILPGWSLSEVGSGNEFNRNLYSSDNGVDNSGEVYSFGATNATDRALGTILSGTLTPTIGAAFTNNTGAIITSLAIAYTGEQWRLGTNNVGRPQDRLDFQISFDAMSLTNGTWLDRDQLDFASPRVSGSVAAVDGNMGGNRTAIAATLAELAIAPGATFWIRWMDFNVTGADDGLAIDDFSITAFTNTAPALDLNGANDAGTGFASAYNENGASAGIVDADVLITDADVGDLIEGATITITDAIAGDALVAGTMPGSIVATGAGTSTITLIGAGTAAEYQQALAAIFFTSASDDPTLGNTDNSRSVTVTVTDGSATSNVATTTIAIGGDNDAPSGTNATITITEDTPRLLSVADFGFTDPDSADAFGEVLITAATGGTMFFDADGAGGGAPIAITTFPQSYAAADFTAGRVSFLANANLNGTGVATLSFQVRDNSGALNDTDLSANTLTFNVTAVNDTPVVPDAPTVTTNEQTAVTILPAINVSDVDLDARNGGNGNYAGASFQLNRNGGPNAEDSFGFASSALFTVNGNALQAGGLTFATILAGGGTLSIDFTSAGTVATSALVDAVLQSIQYTNASNEPPGSVSLAYGLFDGSPGGGQGGGASVFDGGTVTVNINSVNDAPSGTSVIVGINEDTTRTLGVADFGFGDVDFDSFASVTVTGVTGGVLLVSGMTVGMPPQIVTSGTFTAFELNSGRIAFQPTANRNGTAASSIAFQVTDNGGTANGGVDTDPSANVITFDILAVNDAPSGTDTTVTTSEDDAYVFTIADFGFTDLADGNAFASVVITTLPGDGELVLLSNAEPLFVGQIVSVSEITAGSLRFVPDADEFGSPYDSFTFQVQDNGGTANGGANTDPTPNTITINVTPDNVAPVLDLDPAVGGVNAAVAYAEGGAAASIGNALSLTDANVGDLMAGATVVLTNAQAGDTLTVSGMLPAGINALVTPGMGTITLALSGAASAADYELALRAVRFASTSDNPADSAATRTIVTTVDDGLAVSAPATTTVTVTNTNDAPSNLVLATGGTVEERADPGTVVATFAATDVDTGDQLSYSLLDNAGGRFAISAAGVLTVAGVETDFETATFHDVTVVVTDRAGASTNAVFRIAVTDVFDPAVISGTKNDDDPVTGTRFADVIFGLEGNDQILAGAGDDVVFGGTGDDVIAGGTGSDQLAGEDGNDILDGGAGAPNALVGGNGDDVYIVSAIGDTIVEGAFGGTDEVRTALASFVLPGFVENLTYTGTGSFVGVGNEIGNIITGGTASDSLNGGEGNDRLRGGTGIANELIGGLGNDTYEIAAVGDTLIELAGQGTDLVETALATIVLANNVENLDYTGTGVHVGYGNAGDNVLRLGAGRGGLVGGAGNDTLVAGSGGGSELLGGEGNDIYVVATRLDSIVEVASEGVDEVRTSTSSFTLSANVENLTYTGTADFAGTGNGEANRITGAGGNDVLVGLEGADILLAGGGSDLLFGGAGGDTLTGGTGADDFFFLGNEAGIDTITDFTSGSDRILVNRDVFGGSGVFTLVSGGAPVATDGGSTFLYDTTTGLLSYDVDGTGAGAAVAIANLGAGTTLSAGDLVLYQGGGGAGQEPLGFAGDAQIASGVFGSGVMFEQLFA